MLANRFYGSNAVDSNPTKYILQVVLALAETIVKTTAKSLRTDTKRILEAVERGEEVVVSKRGSVCARIVPVDKKTSKNMRESALFGVWKDRKDMQDVEAYIDSLRSGRL